MQVSIETTGPLNRTMRVEVPEESISKEVQDRLVNLSRTTKVQGFRPGKVPMKIIQQRFGTRVRQEVIGQIVQSSFYEAISKENLRPAGNPNIDKMDADAGKGLSYTANFEVYPEIELTPIEELEIEKTVCEITDADVDKMIDVLRKQRRTTREVDREAANEDVVEIDFDGMAEGESFAGGEAKDFKVEIGSNTLIEGFEAGLIGKKAGDETTLNLNFPEEYHKEELAGKPVEFKIKVNKVHELVMPEMDDEFFAGFGVKDGGEESFRQEIREHMGRESEGVVRSKIRDSVMTALHDANQVELPSSLVEMEMNNLKSQFKNNLKSQGLEIPDDDERLTDPALFEDRAKKRVALQLLVAEIIQKNELKADQTKVRELIEKNAGSYEDPSAIVNWYYEDKQRLAEVEALVMEDEVIEWISARAKVNEVNLPFDDLMNKGQTEAV